MGLSVLLDGFAGVALLIACVDIYGVLAYAMSRRTGEIAVRMVPGATPLGMLSGTATIH